MIDEREVREFELTLKEFEETFFNLMQSHRRILLLLNTAQKMISRPKQNTGDCCKRCGGVTLIRTGTCITCQDCGNNEGCG